LKLSRYSSFDKFIEGSESPYYTAVFRVLVAAFTIFQLYLYRNSILDIYGEHGIIDWTAAQSYHYKYVPEPSVLYKLISFTGISSDQFIHALVLTFVIALVFLLFGLFTRISAIACWVLSYLTLYGGISSGYGMHMFLHIAFFYLMLMPCGKAISIDNLRKKSGMRLVDSWPRKVLQLHIAIMYASTGIEKAVGDQWWNGEALWRSMNMPYHTQYDMSWMANYPVGVAITGIGILAVEIFYIVCIWIKDVRVIWLCITIMMHVFIGVFLGLWLFGLMMIILNLGAFGPEVYNDLKNRRKLKLS
jgi:hypothetical protein